MDKKPKTSQQRRREILRKFSRTVGKKEARRIQGMKEKDQTVWFGFGMFGVVGWSVAIPTLIGIAIGVWIDRTWPSQFSWTLMLLIAGLMLGCLNAWYWVQKGGISR
ncbi:MAG: AtpZ/AtpI family protein [Desulfomonilia bacterium]|nr:AtpZ/AtpI family protein [Desulfomonilia bacterium]